MKHVLVTGGTGTVGRVVVHRLLESGHRVRVASRRKQPDGTRPYEWSTVDYRSGDGLTSAVAGVDTIVHCAASTSGTALDERLTAAAAAAGRPHLVYISIVGVDRIPFPYYRNKLAAERVVRESGLPWTILGTTQFHDLLRVFLALLARSPVMPVFDLPFQPVDTAVVGERLADLAAGEPAGRVPDLGGPQVESLPSLARQYLRASGRRRVVAPVRLPGGAFRGFRDGHHLAPDHAVGGTTFEEYLAQHPARRTLRYRTGAA